LYPPNTKDMSENTTPEHNGILVVANNYRRPWGTGKTVQQARKNGYGIRKTDHQTIYYFRHNHWAVTGYGSPVYPPDVEPPVAVTMYKGEIIKMTLHGRGGVDDRGWKINVDIMEHPDSDAAEKDKVKGKMVYEEQNSEYEFNEKNDNFNSPTYMKKTDMVEYEPGKWCDKKYANETA
jgi:hypothetical protein